MSPDIPAGSLAILRLALAGAFTVIAGPMALTRAKCPEGSLHDHLVKQWPFIRSYVLKDGRLFLSLMADGGIYEFAPVKKTP
jgi:hypothetical protein